MAARAIDVLVVTEPSNIFYLTGYDAWSFYVVQAVVVGGAADQPLWVGRAMDAASARLSTYLDDSSIRPYPDSFVQSDEDRPEQFLALAIKELGGEHGAVGVELGAYYYTARTHQELARALPRARFVDAELLVNWLRIRKSEAELAYMREAGRIADAAMRRADGAAMPGARESSVAAAIYEGQISGTTEYGGGYTSTPPLVCCGPRTVAPHAPWTDDLLTQDSRINIELAGCRHRYHVPIGRSICLGDPPGDYLSAAEAVVDGLEAALEAARPGVACEELELAWRRRLQAHGFEKDARIGYSIGIAFPPTWGERTASIRPGDRTVLEPAMCFHLMTALWLEDEGVVITQSFEVTDNGSLPLTTLPRELIVRR